MNMFLLIENFENSLNIRFQIVFLNGTHIMELRLRIDKKFIETSYQKDVNNKNIEVLFVYEVKQMALMFELVIDD